MKKQILNLGAALLALALAACGGGGDGSSGDIVIANATPVANAGAAQSVVSGSLVTLAGSASSDANGDALTYNWSLTSKPAGSAAVLTDTGSPVPAFTADVAGTYVATLTVSDGTASSVSETVTVTVTAANAAPVANAGTAQNVLTGAVVNLDGSASSDANGDALTSSWSLTSRPVGSTAALTDASSPVPAFTADVAGTYVATLTVSDGTASSSPETVTVTATAANATPVANAGAAQNVLVGAVVGLDGSASSDANGDTLTYGWSLTGKPAGSTAALSDTSSPVPTFTADVAGAYVATLTVGDGAASSVSTTVTVTATAAPTLTLLKTSETPFGSQDSPQPLPYAITASSGSSCTGTCPTVKDVASFKLRASGASYTVINLQAVNLTSSSSVIPVFSGLSSGQVVAAGETVAFKLQAPTTAGSIVTLEYSFTIQETGLGFVYRVTFQTN